MTSTIQWSDVLKDQTRQALESHGLDMPVTPMEHVSFKNADGGYGLMTDPELKRIAVIGSRDFGDYARLEAVLEPHLPAVLVSGGAKGADAHAEKVGVPVEVHYPDGTVSD